METEKKPQRDLINTAYPYRATPNDKST